MREEVENKLNIKAVDIYGLSEVIGPGVAQECLTSSGGMHIFEDHFLPEIIDPDTGETLPSGERGELVFTTLTKEAFPVIRYRTKDITSLHYETCNCGRTLVRMDKVTGRSDDMLIIRGVNVFPSQIEYAIMGLPDLAAQYQIILERPDALDVFIIKAELTEKSVDSSQQELEALKRKIKQKVNNITGLSPIIELVKPGELPRTVGKAKRVLDMRSGKI